MLVPFLWLTSSELRRRRLAWASEGEECKRVGTRTNDFGWISGVTLLLRPPPPRSARYSSRVNPSSPEKERQERLRLTVDPTLLPSSSRRRRVPPPPVRCFDSSRRPTPAIFRHAYSGNQHPSSIHLSSSLCRRLLPYSRRRKRRVRQYARSRDLSFPPSHLWGSFKDSSRRLGTHQPLEGTQEQLVRDIEVGRTSEILVRS